LSCNAPNAVPALLLEPERTRREKDGERENWESACVEALICNLVLTARSQAMSTLRLNSITHRQTTCYNTFSVLHKDRVTSV
jgi:hypothetical protein